MVTNFDQQGRSPASEAATSNDDLLQVTIFNKDKALRKVSFDEAWQSRWNAHGNQPQCFQTIESESPFARFSSRGWKVHLAFEKGREKEVAEFLYTNGLYFKVESQQGTYFNGNRASGATIYIGSHENMVAVVSEIENNLCRFLTDGVVATFGSSGKTVAMGSGSDIEIKPKITARFDVARTPHGWLEGNKKYAEHGIASWTGLGGIPILKSREAEVARIEGNWNRNTPGQRTIYLERVLRRIYEESKQELIKDFGEDFVFGKKADSRTTT